jgi:hypothetical protein
VFPSVLQATQLCPLRCRSFFDVATAILLAAEYLHCWGMPSFPLSLDFFHASDRVSVQWLDPVLKAMAFGVVLCCWAVTMHRKTFACFMLHTLLTDMAVEFSICQGDLEDTVFFVIYIEPFLGRPEAGAWRPPRPILMM